MPDANLQRALDSALEEVLEKMFFLEACGEETSACAAGPAFAARVSFSGSAQGELRVRVTAAAARGMAADFLVSSPGALGDENVSEVICELANMLCGSVLSRACGEGSYRLAAPRAGFADEPGGIAAAASRTLNIGAGAVTAEVEFTTTICRTETALAS